MKSSLNLFEARRKNASRWVLTSSESDKVSQQNEIKNACFGQDHSAYLLHVIIISISNFVLFKKFMTTSESQDCEIFPVYLALPPSTICWRSLYNFLDLSIYVSNCEVHYRWYSEDFHSGITLDNKSCKPSHIKSNFVRSSFQYVKDRCSDEDLYNECAAILTNRLKNNSQKDFDNYKQKNKKPQNVNKK